MLLFQDEAAISIKRFIQRQLHMELMRMLFFRSHAVYSNRTIEC